jgi:hypothetical protein
MNYIKIGHQVMLLMKGEGDGDKQKKVSKSPRKTIMILKNEKFC